MKGNSWTASPCQHLSRHRRCRGRPRGLAPTAPGRPVRALFPGPRGCGTFEGAPPLPPISCMLRAFVQSFKGQGAREGNGGREAEGRAFHPRCAAPKTSPWGLEQWPHLAAPAPPGHKARWQVLSWGWGGGPTWHSCVGIAGNASRGGLRGPSRGGAVPRQPHGSAQARHLLRRTQVLGSIAPAGLGGPTSTRGFPRELRHPGGSTSCQGCSGRVSASRSTSALPCAYLVPLREHQQVHEGPGPWTPGLRKDRVGREPILGLSSGASLLSWPSLDCMECWALSSSPTSSPAGLQSTGA